MKKITILVFGFLLLPVSATAETKKFCDEIQRFRIWAGGSDTYGVWVEFKNNPTDCAGGFYIKHDVSNKNIITSFLMAEKAQNHRVCVQVVTHEKIVDRCRLNYAYNP